MSIQWIHDSTHCHVDTSCFYKKVNDQWHLVYENGDHSRSDSLYNGEINELDLVTRQQPKPWSGPEDGLPPVGERVDYMGDHCTVVAHVMEQNEKGAILQGADNWFYGTEITIDPIRTAADIAADARETAIRELMDIAQVDCRVTAARLVDAGFKREVV